MPRFSSTHRPDAAREEVLDALLHADRSHHDELGRTEPDELIADSHFESSPREQGAAAINLHNVDE